MTRQAVPRQLFPDLCIETAFWKEGYQLVSGIDEAGRGAWAGPVVAAAVIFSHTSPNLQSKLEGVRDSKQMTARQRDRWAEKIKEVALAFSTGIAESEEIDRYGIVPATRLAMQRAVESLCLSPDYLVIDALSVPALDIAQTSYIKGDSRSLSIAAASVIAKTARDRMMITLDKIYPGYGFCQHKGYGVRQHRQNLEILLPCPAHRRTFRPVSQLLTDST